MPTFQRKTNYEYKGNDAMEEHHAGAGTFSASSTTTAPKNATPLLNSNTTTSSTRKTKTNLMFRCGMSFMVLFSFAWMSLYLSHNQVETFLEQPTQQSLSSSYSPQVNGSRHRRRIHLWTYPGPPKDRAAVLQRFDVQPFDVLLCSYSLACAAFHDVFNHTKTTTRSGSNLLHDDDGGQETNQQQQQFIQPLLNLRAWTRATPYEEFVNTHMFQKLVHRDRFPHVLFSVAVCTMVLYDVPPPIVSSHDNQDHDDQKDEDWGYALMDEDLLQACKAFRPTTTANMLLPITFDFDMPLSERFAVLTYDDRVQKAPDTNSGDEIQSMAASQWQPFVTDLVDRDQGYVSIKDTQTHLIGNAWYGTRMQFPPNVHNPYISFLSIHTSSIAQRTMVLNHLEYWKQYTELYGPVGARDSATLEFFMGHGIAAYLSLCFTLMYNLPLAPSDLRNKVILVDAQLNSIPSTIDENSILKLECNIVNGRNTTSLERFSYAFNLLNTYASQAKLVITSRIHVALPSMAMGLPVVFVEPCGGKKLPGGGGKRTAGISDLFHLYRPCEGEFPIDMADLNTNSTNTISSKNNYANPGVHRADRYRASFWHHLKRRSPYYSETARLFGMIPFQRLGKGVPNLDGGGEELHSSFHFIFTTGPDTLNWRVIRSVESVFYHHPNARVTIHSNSLPLTGSKLDDFVESGYDLVVEPFDILTMLKQTKSSPAMIDQFWSKIELFRQGRFWYSHESDLLRYLIMWTYGGVYFDTDMYTQRPIPKSMTNLLGRETQTSVNGAAMIFERHHPFQAKAIDEYLKTYHQVWREWGNVGPSLVSRLVQSGDFDNQNNNTTSINTGVTVLTTRAFQPIHFYAMSSWCFTAPLTHSEADRINYKETLAIHLNNKISSQHQTTKRGTICDEVLNRYCIFCNEMHQTP